MKARKLKFAKGNAKLGKHTAIFSLPAGFTCPGALLCLSRANRETGKLTDGPKNQFRCYAATGENLFRNIRISRWRNFELLKQAGTQSAMASLIQRWLPVKNTKLVRVHSSGDFFSQAYFDAWMDVARMRPSVIFYCYTKALNFWIARLGNIPDNFRLCASRGGRFDALIEQYNLRSARVVFSEAEAKTLNLPIDHDDTHLWNYRGNFALLIHGTQPAGTEAARIVYSLRKVGQNGYKSDYFDHYKKK